MQGVPGICPPRSGSVETALPKENGLAQGTPTPGSRTQGPTLRSPGPVGGRRPLHPSLLLDFLPSLDHGPPTPTHPHVEKSRTMFQGGGSWDVEGWGSPSTCPPHVYQQGRPSCPVLGATAGAQPPRAKGPEAGKEEKIEQRSIRDTRAPGAQPAGGPHWPLPSRPQRSPRRGPVPDHEIQECWDYGGTDHSSGISPCSS